MVISESNYTCVWDLVHGPSFLPNDPARLYDSFSHGHPSTAQSHGKEDEARRITLEQTIILVQERSRHLIFNKIRKLTFCEVPFYFGALVSDSPE